MLMYKDFTFAVVFFKNINQTIKLANSTVGLWKLFFDLNICNDCFNYK